MVSTVKVHNVSLKATEQDIKEFFSFSGYIVHVEMQSADERSQFAYISFQDDQGAERAMLLTGATIVDMAVIITPATNYVLPAAVSADLESKNAVSMESALRKAEDAVGSMLAKGYILGKDAVEKAKTFDEKHQLTSTATAKVSLMDRRMGLSQKFTTGSIVVNEKMKEMDEKYQVAEKTKTALAAAEQTVSTAGSAIMSNRYILTGAAWVTEAYNKVTTTPTAAGSKANERMLSEQDGKDGEGESSEEEDDLSKSYMLESPKMGQKDEQESKDQEGDQPKTNMPGNPEIGKQDLENQHGEISTAHAQEITEIVDREHEHQEAELPKAHLPESILMSEQSEQEHKHMESCFANNQISGSPVTIPVCMATTDGDSSNSPNKPEPVHGFI